MPCQIPRKTNNKPSPHPTPTILRRKSPSDIKPVDQLTSHSPHPLPFACTTITDALSFAAHNRHNDSEC